MTPYLCGAKTTSWHGFKVDCACVRTSNLAEALTQRIDAPAFATQRFPGLNKMEDRSAAASATPQRRIVILTEGYSDPITAKTAACLLRYRTDEIVALLDSTQCGGTAESLLGVGGDVPVVGSVGEAAAANTLLIGIAPPGGRVPASWRASILDALEQGMDVVSGLHEFLND
ncbi:MAG: DUF1611 domain-containing protein, partial [Planctomycetota bacterium]